jgi:23S rRNA-/tRNA-specific pseudouridylate synthase
MPDPTVLFQAAGVVAVLKPAGLATQAPPGVDSVEAWLRAHVVAPGGYVGVPHRLDRAVSGVLLMAVTPRAARQLSRQFERRQIGKHYVALVREAAAVDEGGVAEWRDVVEKVPDEARARISARGATGGREAVTLVRFGARIEGVATESLRLVTLEPLTGRMHQLRVQAAARGMPIAGDSLYGDASKAAWCGMSSGAHSRLSPIALHAWRISYRDPDTGLATTAEAPLPAYWPAAARRWLPPSG